MQPPGNDQAFLETEREYMVETQLRPRRINDPRVLQAMLQVPRHLFVPADYRHLAYTDGPLPIGSGQTISQPYIVARMTELLLADGARRVLEIGTGSGYQTAVLCALTQEVYSVERIEPLHKSARRCLQELGFRNFRLKLSDGSDGWPEYGPYDAILVTAAAADVPAALLAQLAPGGRLLIPVGNSARQELLSIRKTAEGVVREHVELVNFVPLVQDVS